MKQSRLDSFSDGMFAIIVTLLAFELRVPAGMVVDSELDLIAALLDLGPIFLSFVLSFALIFTYWRAHHYIVSVYARSINTRLTSINALFFFFVALIPFSTRLLGEYSASQTAIFVYGLNIVFITLTLYWMRSYVLSSGFIDHGRISPSEKRRGAIRLLIPFFCAILAILLSYVDTQYSFMLFTAAILFNILPRTSYVATEIIDTVHDTAREIAQ